MFLLNYKYIIIGVVAFMLLGGVLDRFVIPKGISEEEHMAKVKYELLEQKTKERFINYIKTRKQDEITTKNITADSTFIWTTSNITDSLRNYYNPR